ncbi:MmcQ/YjbR family DNA-binding protein [Pontibacter pamirensis]|uniref:MmcQ/YjbR family DNA-binding protein n=1 Tax=Pontibacter pamirensis TaxID=2562824 RepID=UPI0013894DF2|nr:MmcQ/YjbR family DNA-binding protein [Pontibacter pamirensis]
MLIEELQGICRELPGVTEDIKWENDLCFCVGGKMFLAVGLNQSPTTASFKATPEGFAAMTERSGFAPAPYLARNHWVLAENIHHLTKQEWIQHAREAYKLVAAKLPKKMQQALQQL